MMDGTGHCCFNGPAFDSIEGKERRKKGARFLRMLSLIQIVTSVLSIVIGIVSIGVALTNPAYPKINGYAVLNGILVLIGGIYGMKATKPTVVAEAGHRVRTYITVHYTLSISCLSVSVLQIVFTGWAVGDCFSIDPEASKKCLPFMRANIILDILVITAGIVLLITCIVGSTFFCCYQRVFGFQDQHERIQQEMELQEKEKSDNQTYGSNVVVVCSS